MATQSVTQFSPTTINTWSVDHAITDGIVVRNGDQILWRPTIGTDGDPLREAAAEAGFGSATVSGCTITGGPLYENDLVKTVTITATEGQSWSASIAITHNTTSSSIYPTGDPSALYLAAAAQVQGAAALQGSYPNAYSVLMSNNPATGNPWLDANGDGNVTSSDGIQFLRYPAGLHASANTARIEAALAHLQTNINSVESSINSETKTYPAAIKTFTISGTVAGVQQFGFQVLDGSNPQKTIIDSTANPKLFQELARDVVIRLWPEDRCIDGTSYNGLGFIHELVVDLPGVTSQTDLDNNYIIERVDFGTIGDSGSVQQRDWTHNFEYHSAGKIKFTWGRGDGGVDTSVTPSQLCYSLVPDFSMGTNPVYYYPQDHDCACTTLDDIICAYNFYAINKTLALSSAAIDSHGIEVKNANGKTMFNSNQPSQVAVFRGTVSGAEEPFNYPFEQTLGDDWQVVDQGRYLASGWTNGHVMIIPPHVEGEQHDLTLSTGTKTVEEVDLTNLAAVYGANNISTYDDLIDYYANHYTNNVGLTGWGNVTGKYLVALKRTDSNGNVYKSGVWDGYQYTNQTVNGNKLFLTYLGPKRYHNSLTNAGNNFLLFYETNWSNVGDYYDIYECNEDVSSIRSNGANVTLYPVVSKRYFTDFYVRPQSQFTGDWYITVREYFRSLNDGNTGWVNADIPKYRPRAVHVFDGNTQTNTNRNTFDVIMTVNSRSFGDINTTGGTGIVNAPTGNYGLHVQTSDVLQHTANHPTQQMTAFTTKTRTAQVENVFTEDIRPNTFASTSSNKVVGTSSTKRYLNARPVMVRDVDFTPKRNRQLSWQWNSNNDIRIKFGLKNQAYTYETNSWLGPVLCQIVNFGDGM